LRLGISLSYEKQDVRLKFAKQLGVRDIIIHTPQMGDGYFEFMDLVNLRTRIESEGLELVAIENLPREYYIKAMLGQPGRDEQIENWCKTLRSIESDRDCARRL